MYDFKPGMRFYNHAVLKSLFEALGSSDYHAGICAVRYAGYQFSRAGGGDSMRFHHYVLSYVSGAFWLDAPELAQVPHLGALLGSHVEQCWDGIGSWRM